MSESTTTRTAKEMCPRIASETREFTDGYEEIIADCLERSPVAWDETYNRCFVMGYQELVETARDWRTFSSASGVTQEFAPRLLPLESDPPSHRDMRVLLNPFFTAAAMSTIESGIRMIADELIDAFIGSGRVEVLTQYSRAFPGRVFFALVMNLPEGDLENLQHLAEQAITPSSAEIQIAGFTGVVSYVSELVDRRTGETDATDLVGAIANATLGDRAITRDEAISICTMLIMGGLETTASTIGVALKHYAEHPADQAQLREHPELFPDAVEEVLRLFGPTIQLNRLALEDTSIAGVPISKGERVALSFASANRDPREFENPREYELQRPNIRHVAFGIGLHRCLGSHLARPMLEIGLRAFIERVGPFTVAPGTTPTFAVSGVRTIESVEITFEVKGSH